MGSGALNPRGPVAEAMADLWWLMLGLGVAVFVVFAVLLSIALFRRPSDEPGAERRLQRGILGWGVIGPAVIVVVVFGATVWAMRAMPTDAPADALTIDVVARQWTYDIRYPDGGVTVGNELHMPTGRSIALRLRSVDVIHSFWVPELGGKMDMLPDGVNTLILQADEPGEYVSRCAEFCGVGHTGMQLTVVAEPPERFDAWLSEQRAAATDGRAQFTSLEAVR